MNIREISKEEFDSFSINNQLTSFYQTSAYGQFMEKNGYKLSFIGGFEEDKLKCASLILSKTLSIHTKYGYSPRGFLIDYLDYDLLKRFTIAIKKYFNIRGYAFIKINPIITINEINKKDGTKYINTLTKDISDNLQNLGYKKLKDNLYFESILPKYNPIINLKNFSFETIENKLQNRIKRVSNKGLTFIKGDLYNINDFYELVKNKDDVSDDFYKNLYKVFNDNNMIDLFLVEVNYHSYLLHLQDDYNNEHTINEKITQVFQLNPTNKDLYNEKMISDRKLNEINQEMSDTNTKIQNGVFKEIIGGALVIKYNKIAYFYETGFKKYYNRMFPNHFLHYNVLNYYKENNYNFADLNGVVYDFSKENPYKGLNEFKLSFNPRIFEYIGEYDLIINQTKYSLLWTTKALHKEFEKKGLKSNS